MSQKSTASRHTVWVIVWNTESGDSGQSGYFIRKPSIERALLWIQEYLPDDYEAGTVYHHIQHLNREQA